MTGRAPFDVEAVRARLAVESGPQLWRRLEELADLPEVRRHLEAEFPDIVQAGSIDRRDLLRLLGASLTLAGLAACDRSEVARPAPLLSQPRDTPGHTPGVPMVFATSLDLDGYGRGVLVKTQEGRPIKIDGNPLHPANLGATDVFAEAEVLSLYDPDRSRAPLENGQERDWSDVERFLRPVRNELVVNEGRGLAVLLPPIASPTVDRLIGAAQQLFPQARWHRYAPIADDHARAGATIAFGQPLDCIYDLTKADVIVTLGGDLFAFEPGHIRYAADYQARRRADRDLPQLVAIESCPSLVGARADRRIVLRPRAIEAFAGALAAAIETGQAPDGAHPAVAELAADLRRAGPRGLVTVGREQPPVVHALAHAVNARIGAAGTTVRYVKPVLPLAAGAIESIIELAQAIAAGTVSRLVILGGNPAYDAPADLGFADLIRRVPLSLHLGYHRDETAAACRWHIPQCHALESFGDLRAFDGTLGLRQPATVRLAPSLSLEQTLGLFIGQTDERELVQGTWREAWGAAFEERWSRSLEDGVVAGTAFEPVLTELRPDWDRPVAAVAPAQTFDIVFTPDPSLWDGRYANNGWLQELPKPLTKQAWGNAALVAPDTAARLGISTGDAIEITAGERSMAAPVWLLPGHAPDVLSLSLGYGRLFAGRVGSEVGFNAYRLRSSQQPWITAGEVRPTGGRIALITTQQHHSLYGRDIIRVVAPDQPQAAGVVEPRPSLYPEWRYEGYAWGMAIDLDACIGCNACVIACQAENNVAVVGPDQVAKGREMHWLRIDRYYAGAPAAPQTYFQPVLCMHCEKAPCEVVCPVNATVHSAEGLNDMVYNRCIGTRTCSNNCPYKVRRFNFLDYQSTQYAPSREALNPQVTIRERGVMEKCTFCVQRISAARIDARIEDRRVRDSEVATACQQACPTQAIVFGDLNDAQSAVSRLKQSERNYALLGALDTQPRTTYLARVESAPAEPGGESE